MLVWPVKSPTEIVEREWLVPTADDDSLASVVTVESGITKDAQEINGDIVELTLSGGAAAATGTVSITATTANGLIVTETFYQPVRNDGFMLTPTGREIADFALRKIAGLNAAADAAEQQDALERLTDMLAGWAGEGADLAVNLPVEANDILYIPDWSVEGVKAALALSCAEFYGAQIDRTTALAAQRGLQRIKFLKLPDEREGVDYF